MRGLTSEEVRQEIRDGHVNNVEEKTGRTYADILAKNTLTPYNIILFVIGALFLFLGNLLNAVAATGIIAVNILISTVQEMRAKRRLDKIALLTRPKAIAVRDGEETEIQQSEIVRNDVIVLRAGEQALVDGEVLECSSLEIDESLLTGESSTVRKEPGDKIYSGSVCIAGEGYYRVTAFGYDSYASEILRSARKMTSKKTPLQMETSSITSILMGIAMVLILISLVCEFLIRYNSWEHTLEVFAICLDVVPIALFLLITLTYMVAAVRMADSGVLLQSSNSVESLSHVDTVCMDKTGTITTNKLRFESARYFMDESEADRLASMFATATGSKNKTVGVLLEKYGETPCELLEEIQFTSKRKFSAVKISDGGKEHSLYMGAWNVIGPHCSEAESISQIISEESKRGLRTVVLCEGDGTLSEGEEPRIPELRPVMMVSIRDEIRSNCRETIQVFLDNGMDLKVISGDDPATVDAMFSLADIPGTRKLITGAELDAMPESERDKAILESNIFGRMKPDDKEYVISSLKRNGRYVAMIGDGVNDVRSIKSAQVGVSLESGSNAAKGVSDMILLGDDFSALPKALVEGRKTVSGMRDILKLYLTRNFALALMIFIIYLAIGSIPMKLIQNTFYAFISVAILAFFMTLFSKPEVNRNLILPGVLKFAVPSSIIIVSFGLLVYAATWIAVGRGLLVPDFEWMASVGGFDTAEAVIEHLSWSGFGVEEICARSNLVLFVTLAGLGQIMMVSPYCKFMSIDGKTNKSLVPWVILGLIALLLTAGFAFFPWVMINIVNFAVFEPKVYAILGAAVVVWFIVERTLLKHGFLSGIASWFESKYMKKLEKEYAKGDVKEERSSIR